jgi:hypothetical protein
VLRGGGSGGAGDLSGPLEGLAGPYADVVTGIKEYAAASEINFNVSGDTTTDSVSPQGAVLSEYWNSESSGKPLSVCSGWCLDRQQLGTVLEQQQDLAAIRAGEQPHSLWSC